jgi:mono/diheme cytochrome c family protein
LVVGWAGFRGQKTTNRPLELLPDMDDQPKYGQQGSSAFFADGNSARPPIPGTAPRGIEGYATVKPAEYTVGTSYYHTGRMGEVWGEGFPTEVTVDAGLIRRGNERYNVYCSICHGYAGDGKGITANAAYGSPTPRMRPTALTAISSTRSLTAKAKWVLTGPKSRFLIGGLSLPTFALSSRPRRWLLRLPSNYFHEPSLRYC